MYAVIQHGGHQYRVNVGDRLLVDHLDAEVGTTVKLDDVLLLAGSADGARTSEQLRGAVVTASISAQRRGRKLRVMTYKAKKRHRRTLGYRSRLTELIIEDISAPGVSATTSEPATRKPRSRKPAAHEQAAAEHPAAAAPKAPAAEREVDEPAPAEPAAEAPATPRPRRRTARTTKSERSADGA